MARITTVGHSTRSTEELVDILRAHGVARVVDIRRFPGSRRHPHLAREPLAASLEAAGIGYTWLPALGGRRRRVDGSPHTAWREPGFAGYADHMDTPEFAAGIAELEALAASEPVAIMCAEAVPERCHRRLVSDALVVRGHEVVHLLDPKRTRVHRLPPFARVDRGRIVYDGDPGPAQRSERSTRSPP